MSTVTFGIAIFRDEADIVEQTVRNMTWQVDGLVVADNRSTDGTREILEQLGVAFIDDPVTGYYQSQKMTKLAALAAAEGADWIVPFDADEIWRSPHGRIADVLADCPAAVAPATVFDHVATGDFAVPPLERMRWRRSDPLGLPKVACRAALPVTIAQGNHGASYDTSIEEGLLEVRHFPYRSPAQFISKIRNGAAAYAATDLPDHVGAHWRQYGRHLDENGEQAVIDDIFLQHFHVETPENDPGLIHDPVRAATMAP